MNLRWHERPKLSECKRPKLSECIGKVQDKTQFYPTGWSASKDWPIPDYIGKNNHAAPHNDEEVIIIGRFISCYEEIYIVKLDRDLPLYSTIRDAGIRIISGELPAITEEQ
jgi:hypothetical protein